MTAHIDMINEKQKAFFELWGFEPLTVKEKKYQAKDRTLNLHDDTLSKKYKTIFEDEQ